MITSIQPTVFDFLEKISVNNNREWFTANKADYVTAHTEMKAFAATLSDLMNQLDKIEKVKVYRIYRDVRFSKNKTPYKNSLNISLVRATKWLRGGYYFHIEPGNCFMGAGFWNPNSADLKRIRQEIAASPTELREILADSTFKSYFGTLEGEKVKTAPRGYAKDHEAIDLLRYKQFIVRHDFTQKEVCTPDFVHQLVKAFQAVRPFFDYMSDILTTDENGVPIE